MDFKDIIFKHTKSIVKSRSECDTSVYLGEHKFDVPIVASNMPSIINTKICNIFDKANWFYIQERMSGTEFVYNFVKEAQETFRIVSISVGVKEEWINLLQKIKNDNLRVDYITIDVSLSYTDNILPIVNFIKKNFKDTFLIVGNGCEPEWIDWLETLGVDCAKVGVGNGGSCSTYNATGIKSNIKSLVSCTNAKKNIKIIADGGFRLDDRSGMICPSDFNIALRFGSDFCMTGSAWSRCINSPTKGEEYFGNASEQCNSKHIEGVTIKTQSNGKTVEDIMKYIKESLQSSISFFGGKDISAIKTAQIQ